jgi:ABC-type transporter Mla subunit MlaD
VTTEFNTLFETVTAIAERVDPIKLNATLAATAEALTGLGDRFGESLENGNLILADVNARMPGSQRRGRGAADLVPTTKLLDDYRGMLFCTIRNYYEVAPRIQESLGGDNGYSLASSGTATGAGNPGCWQKVTRDLWPAPYLVMDTGFSLAPYNYIELGQPIAIDYVWGRQVGELTINP